MKFIVTTKCPDCGKDFTREMYEGQIINGCALDLCTNCCQVDEYGNPVIVIENEINWEKISRS